MTLFAPKPKLDGVFSTPQIGRAPSTLEAQLVMQEHVKHRNASRARLHTGGNQPSSKHQ